MNNNTIKIFIFSILLFFISFLVIIINGKNYLFKVDLRDDNIDINKINIKIEDEKIIKIDNTSISDNTLNINLKSYNKGKTSIEVNYDDKYYLETFYVHSFGVITRNLFFGRCNYDILIPISIFIITIMMFLYFLKKYKNSLRENMYQYKNITYLGFIIFLLFTIINQIFDLLDYHGLYSSINQVIASISLVSIILLPIASIVSILVIFSNIKLIIKEGFSIKNMLGIILGVIIIFLTILPEAAYSYFQASEFIDIHNEGSIYLYIYDFIETFIYLLVAYLECVLLSTIILGIKSAKKVPSFNKDYIIILGCMINKDGSLTPLLKSRVDRAIEFAKLQKEKANKDIVFVTSGGKGSNEVMSEAKAMKNYLVKNGINQKQIILENQSTSTYENIKYSYNIIKEKSKNPSIAFSTTNYHVFRAGLIASNQGIKMEGIGAKTKSYFWINAFIREFIATLFTEKKKHIIMFILVLLICFVLIMITYLSNIL